MAKKRQLPGQPEVNIGLVGHVDHGLHAAAAVRKHGRLHEPLAVVGGREVSHARLARRRARE